MRDRRDSIVNAARKVFSEKGYDSASISEIARAAGYAQLAANLTRAAELTAVPNAEVLRMYELLRPGRASYAQLAELAEQLEARYGAPANAALVREAAEAYRARGLLPQ